MSDHPDAPLPELTPGQESEVRRLLAAARHEEPLPADVADRLDAVLAGLIGDGVRADPTENDPSGDDPAGDDPAAGPAAPVVDLAARRRRRNAAAALLGAAAVIVAGFSIGQVVDVGDGSDNGAGSTAADANRESAAGSAGDQQGGSADLSASPHVQPAPSVAAELPLRLRSTHLERDVSDQLRAFKGTTGDLQAPADAQFDAAGCPIPSPSGRFGLGDLFPALFDGRPAVLAVRPPADGVREADVLDCDTASPLASVTIPAG